MAEQPRTVLEKAMQATLLTLTYLLSPKCLLTSYIRGKVTPGPVNLETTVMPGMQQGHGNYTLSISFSILKLKQSSYSPDSK